MVVKPTLRVTVPAVPLALAASAVLLLSACSSSGGGTAKTSAPPAGTSASAPASGGSGGSGGAAAGGDTITIQDFAYSGGLTVAPGTKITVVDKDSAAHTLTAKDGKFDTGNVAGSGGTATFTAPTTAGSYQLICKYHPQMSGTLTVK